MSDFELNFTIFAFVCLGSDLIASTLGQTVILRSAVKVGLGVAQCFKAGAAFEILHFIDASFEEDERKEYAVLICC
jgi:hypothetical protein